ncbi:MAG TPA: PAS domain-containing sensor histidine kinase [Lentimicrobium sp.]|nr:PAS domain-containing sensor histidine kinase [Lentimicrobium sp.]
MKNPKTSNLQNAGSQNESAGPTAPQSLYLCYFDAEGSAIRQSFGCTGTQSHENDPGGIISDCLRHAIGRLNEHSRNMAVINSNEPESSVEMVEYKGIKRSYLVDRFPLLKMPEGGMLLSIRDVSAIFSVAGTDTSKDSGIGAGADPAADVFFVIDNKGDLTFLSPSVEMLTGYPVNELIGNPAIGISDPKAVETIASLKSAFSILIGKTGLSAADLRPLHYKLAFTRKDGAQRWVEISASPFTNASGEFHGIHGMIRDITDRKVKQDQIKTTLEHERELSEGKSRYISTVSHEFRTPLSIIYSNLQLLEKYRFELDQETIHDAFELSRMAVKSLLRLLDKVTIIDASGKGKLDFKPSEVKLGVICRKIVDEVNELEFVPDRIVLSIEDEDSVVWIDENLFRHIFINLLQNALNYSEKKQKVTFTIKQDTSGFVTFVVADQGIGIPEQDRQFIFEPFYRAGNSRQFKGSGLGLAVVNECLSLHKGRIFLDSKPGQGSTFTVILPIDINE